MGFRNGAFAKIKETENKGNYTKAKIVISKKIKGTDKYVCEFAGWVSFVGKAHQCRPMSGQKIKIGNCDISNGYISKEGEQKFSNAYRATIFDYELQDEIGGGVPLSQLNLEELSSDDDLPF